MKNTAGPFKKGSKKLAKNGDLDISVADYTSEYFIGDDAIGQAMPPLHMLAINGSKSVVSAYLQSVALHEIDSEDDMGRTPLIYSVLGERIDLVDLLLKAGADINKCDVDGRSALHWASYQGNHKIVKILLAKGAQHGMQDKDGRTALHLSISHENTKVMVALIKNTGQTDIDAKDNHEMTTLAMSVFYGFVEHTKLLLKYGATPSCMDSDKRTCLHWTCMNKDPTLARMLLDKDDAILNFPDSDGRTALHMAIGKENVAVVAYLVGLKECDVNCQDNLSRTPLHLAAVLGNTAIARLLLQAGADYAIPDKNGVRALHYAAQNGYQETVTAILDWPGVVDMADNEGCTAFMWAAIKGHVDALSAILKYEHDVNRKDVNGMTALHMSTRAGHVTCVRLLIEYHADVNIADRQQHIPLFYACENGYQEIVDLLLNHGSSANLEDQDLQGRCALHYAAMVDRANIVKLLIQSGLNPNKRDLAGRPPLHFSSYGGFVHSMSVLLEHGADVNMQDNDGRTALHWACRSGSLDAVKLLVLRHTARVNVMEFTTERLTPLDYALLGDHQDVALFMTEHESLTVSSLKDRSATKIQACWRGCQFRRVFQEGKPLLLRHEKMRKEKSTENVSELIRVSAPEADLPAPGFFQGIRQRTASAILLGEHRRNEPLDTRSLESASTLPARDAASAAVSPLPSHLARPASMIEIWARRERSSVSSGSSTSVKSSKSSVLEHPAREQNRHALAQPQLMHSWKTSDRAYRYRSSSALSSGDVRREPSVSVVSPSQVHLSRQAYPKGQDVHPVARSRTDIDGLVSGKSNFQHDRHLSVSSEQGHSHSERSHTSSQQVHSRSQLGHSRSQQGYGRHLGADLELDHSSLSSFSKRSRSPVALLSCVLSAPQNLQGPSSKLNVLHALQLDSGPSYIPTSSDDLRHVNSRLPRSASPGPSQASSLLSGLSSAAPESPLNYPGRPPSRSSLPADRSSLSFSGSSGVDSSGVRGASLAIPDIRRVHSRHSLNAESPPDTSQTSHVASTGLPVGDRNRTVSPSLKMPLRDSEVAPGESAAVCGCRGHPPRNESSLSLPALVVQPTAKPWEIYKREKRRIELIRKKTGAAAKIQAHFRAYLHRTGRSALVPGFSTPIAHEKSGANDNKSDMVPVTSAHQRSAADDVALSDDRSNQASWLAVNRIRRQKFNADIKPMSFDGALDVSDCRGSDVSSGALSTGASHVLRDTSDRLDDADSFTATRDVGTQSDNSAFGSEETADGEPDEREYAALVIQLAWRGYVKEKLLRESDFVIRRIAPLETSLTSCASTSSTTKSDADVRPTKWGKSKKSVLESVAHVPLSATSSDYSGLHLTKSVFPLIHDETGKSGSEKKKSRKFSGSKRRSIIDTYIRSRLPPIGRKEGEEQGGKHKILIRSKTVF